MPGKIHDEIPILRLPAFRINEWPFSTHCKSNNPVYRTPSLKSRTNCKKKFQVKTTPFPVSRDLQRENSAQPDHCKSTGTLCGFGLCLPYNSSLNFYFPAAHGFEIAEYPLKKRLRKLGISWPSTHASLVPLTDGQIILRFTSLTLAHNNNSHSKYMLPASQRLNVPGNYLPPGLQLILHSTFVITGTIPPINIDRGLEQSRLKMRFLFTANLTAARGTKSIVQPLTRMPIDFSPAPSGFKKKETQE